MEAYVELVKAELEDTARLLDALLAAPLTEKQLRHVRVARNAIRGMVEHDDPAKALGAASVVMGIVTDELREATDDYGDG